MDHWTDARCRGERLYGESTLGPADFGIETDYYPQSKKSICCCVGGNEPRIFELEQIVILKVRICWSLSVSRNDPWRLEGNRLLSSK